MRKVWIGKPKRHGKWTAFWIDANGRQRSKSAPNKAAVQYFTAQKSKELNTEFYGDQLVDIAWDELTGKYLRRYDIDQLKPSAKYESANALKHFEGIWGTLYSQPLTSTKITQDLVDEFKLMRGRQTITKKSEKVISKSTLNKELMAVKAMLAWASAPTRRYCRDNIVISKVKVDEVIPNTVDSRDIQRLIAIAKPEWKLRIMLAAGVGMSASSIDALNKEHVDIKRNLIAVFRPKTGKYDWMPIPAGLMGAIKKQWSSLAPGQKFIKGKHWGNYFKKYISSKAGVDCTFHDLRKTCASMIQKAGYSISVAQTLLQHSSIEVTKTYYTDVSSELTKAVNSLPVADWL